MLLSQNSTKESSTTAINEKRLIGWQDIKDAFRLTWQRQRHHLFTSWIHVPLGVMFLLVVTWGFRLAIALAPFRFPAPVIAMLLFFVGLLALDWLSIKFPGRKNEDAEKAQVDTPTEAKRKRFVDPFVALLAPPCEFLLRNMSVMFTPSFILIPAREIIPGREIGLITAWFLITQILAFIFPVLFLWAIDWIGSLFGKGKAISVVLPAGVQMADGETAPTVGLETGAENLQRGSLAAGLSVLTANIIAPISHHSRDIDADAWRHLESTAWEQARQQGDPAVIGNLHAAFGIRSPRSDVSTFHHRHHQRPDRPSRSKTSPARFTLPFLAHRHSSAVMPPVNVTKDDIDLTETEADLETRVNSRRNSLPDVSRRGSKVEFDIPSSDELFRQLPKDGSRLGQGSSKCAEKGKVEAASDDDDDTDPVERLSSWISDLITPTIYLLLTIVGIPLYFVLDVGLPLFLGINILTFILAITVVPPKIRRFLHPILSCSISTVLLIWAFGAMRGLGLMDNLNRFYSVDARYSDLWSPSGYRGPVPGAGDVLFSTLDAGIVALAVPMYRYRSELKANFAKMMVVLTFCAALSLFLWNSIAALMGMDETRSLAFTARFMSTPLAIELAGNIGADESITVILVVLTGIIAAILKDHFFRFMRVDREDHLIVGITMGSTAGAIGASSLISTPKVMAVASLSFVIFGSILLIATAIPPVVDVVRMLA